VAKIPAKVVTTPTMGKVLAVVTVDSSSNGRLLNSGCGSKVLLGLCRHVHIPHIVGPGPMQLRPEQPGLLGSKP